MRNNKGFSTILICVIVLFVCMLIAITIEYAAMFNTAESEKAEAQLKLDRLITAYAVEKYDALKQGDAYSTYITPEKLVSEAYKALGFELLSTDKLTVTKGTLTYVVERPQITYLSDGQFGVEATFTIRLPFEVFGRKIADLTVPVKVVSKYTER